MSEFESSEKTTALVQLAGTVAHELNNIFTAVAGNLSLLGDGADEVQTTETIRDVIRAAQRGIDLTARLQAFAGRQPLRRGRNDANELVLEAVAPMLDSELATIDVQFEIADYECPVYVDRDKFCDTIAELARNASAAMPKGGTLTLQTCIWPPASEDKRNAPRAQVVVRVTDTGAGMSEEVAARALDPMFSTRKHGVDAGWGLSNCAGFVRQCGGRLLLTSRPKRGTRVEIRLPLERD